MGICTTSKQYKKANKFPVEKLFPVDTKGNEVETTKSEFYYFVEWMISFNFYKRLRNNPECSSIRILNDDPKQSSIFKLIKAIDCPYLRDKINSFPSTSSEVTQDKQQGDIEKEHLKAIFYHLAKSNMPKLKKILSDGPPNNMRWFIWLTLAKYSYEGIEAKLNIDNSRAFKVLFDSSSDNMKRTLSREKIMTKSLPELFSINYNYQSCLLNVLSVMTVYDKAIGNSPEINSIISNALIASDFNEEEAFFIIRFVYSIEYGIKFEELIDKDSPRLNYTLFMLDSLIESRCPQIHRYLITCDLATHQWATKWFQSLFGFLDISSSIRVWDCVFALGSSFLLYFSLGCIKYCEKQLYSSQVTTYSELNRVVQQHLNIEKAIKFALNFHLSKYVQLLFDQSFFKHLIESEDKRQMEENKENSSVIDNNDDIHQEKLFKIKELYHKHFFKEDKGKGKLSSEEKKEKIGVIKKLKEIYFKDNAVYQEETQMLCHLANKCFIDYQKEKVEDKKIERKMIQNHSSSFNINKTKSQRINRVKFSSKASQNEFPSGLLLKRNYSLIELNNEDRDSSDISSVNKGHNYSILNQIDREKDLSPLSPLSPRRRVKHKTDLNDNSIIDLDQSSNKELEDSIITPADFNEDSLDEEAMIKMIEENGINSFLKENVPKKIVKVNP